MTIDNPYASPDAGLDSEGPRMRPLAVLVGFLVDFGSSLAAGVVLGIVAAAVVMSRGVPLDRLENAMNSLVWVQVGGLLVGFCGTTLGGYVAARMGKVLPLRHALATGLISVLLGLVTIVLFPDSQPMWVSLVGLALVLPAAALGGYLRASK